MSELAAQAREEYGPEEECIDRVADIMRSADDKTFDAFHAILAIIDALSDCGFLEARTEAIESQARVTPDNTKTAA